MSRYGRNDPLIPLSAPVTREAPRQRRPIVYRRDDDTPSRPATPPRDDRFAALRALLPATAYACAEARPDLWSREMNSAGLRRLYLDLHAIGAVRGDENVWSIPTTSPHPAPTPRSDDTSIDEPRDREVQDESVDCRSQVSAAPAVDAAAASRPISQKGGVQ